MRGAITRCTFATGRDEIQHVRSAIIFPRKSFCVRSDMKCLEKLILKNVVIAPILPRDQQRNFIRVEERVASHFRGLML